MKLARSLAVTSLALAFLLMLCTLSGADGVADKKYEDFDNTTFGNPIKIDNEWFPLKPGTRWTWEGTSVDDEGEEETHRIVFAVTDLTKKVDGVETVVCWDRDFVDDELVETEIVFFAQDNDGTVWNLGEYPEEYEDGKLIASPGWLHGIKDAKAGIYMPANPKLGDSSFSQGWAPSVPWTDRAVVHKTGEKTTGPYGSFEDVLVFKETCAEEPDAYALKYYARGVGTVRVRAHGTDQEGLDLVKIEQLGQEELAEVRKEALALAHRSRENAKDFFAQSQPVQLPGGVTFPAPVVSQETPQQVALVRKISDEKAKEIALRKVPGEVMAIDVEKKLGAKRIVVEVLADDGTETDVIIDMQTGEVLATET